MSKKENLRNIGKCQSTRNTVGALDWLTQFVQGLKSNEGISVPCGDCNACCQAFDAVRTDEGKILMSLPDGSCSMLQSGKCSIYSDRPRTCQYYDCRTHYFSGVDPRNPKISRAIKSWKVISPTPEDAAVVSIIQTIAAAISKKSTRQEFVAVHACILAYELIHESNKITGATIKGRDD